MVEILTIGAIQVHFLLFLYCTPDCILQIRVANPTKTATLSTFEPRPKNAAKQNAQQYQNREVECAKRITQRNMKSRIMTAIRLLPQDARLCTL